MFKKAVKYESKLRLAIAGPSGSGKTYTALTIGTSLGKVAFVDTEHGSASKYADLFDFDVVNMEPPFHPNRFVEMIAAAADSGYDVVVLDSLSHAWNGSGGLLEVVDDFAKRMKTSNTFAAWKDATPIQNKLVEAIVAAPIHVIATMRSKQEYVLEQIEKNGRTISQPKKVGMAPIQRDSFEYEFDVYLDMDADNNAIVGKTRCPALHGKVINRPGDELSGVLINWLSGKPSPPPKTQNEIRREMATAGTLESWAIAAYQLPDVRNMFADDGRVADWYRYAIGNFLQSHNDNALESLYVYTSAIANGVAASQAAKRSKDKFAETAALFA